jgi:hypothetical protein
VIVVRFAKRAGLLVLLASALICFQVLKTQIEIDSLYANTNDNLIRFIIILISCFEVLMSLCFGAMIVKTK